jgi:tRNA-splicing ligase RtcB
METVIITQEDLQQLGVHHEEAYPKFLRVANGLLNNGVYPKSHILLLFAQMIDSPKKFSFSKNKLTNLALYTKHLKEIGQEFVLSEYGQSLLEAEKTNLNMNYLKRVVSQKTILT